MLNLNLDYEVLLCVLSQSDINILQKIINSKTYISIINSLNHYLDNLRPFEDNMLVFPFLFTISSEYILRKNTFNSLIDFKKITNSKMLYIQNHCIFNLRPFEDNMLAIVFPFLSAISSECIQ